MFFFCVDNRRLGRRKYWRDGPHYGFVMDRGKATGFANADEALARARKITSLSAGLDSGHVRVISEREDDTRWKKRTPTGRPMPGDVPESATLSYHQNNDWLQTVNAKLKRYGLRVRLRKDKSLRGDEAGSWLWVEELPGASEGNTP